MISLADVIEFKQKMHEHSVSIVAKKGYDYNREQQEQGDTLFNLRVCELLGVTETAEQGILTRLTDKLMRLISLTKPGVEPKNESVYDTIVDIHNYIDYLYMLWEERNKKIVETQQLAFSCMGDKNLPLYIDNSVDNKK